VDCTEEIAGGKIALYFFKLVKQLLATQLEGLRNSNKQPLIGPRRDRARLRTRKQLLQVEIAGIGK